MLNKSTLEKEIIVEIHEGSLLHDVPVTFPIRCLEIVFGPVESPEALFNEKSVHLLLTLCLK